MKKIIKFIMDQELELLDDYPTLIEPIATEFDVDLGVAEGIINTVIEWERLNEYESLETVLENKFPSYVTKLN